MAELAHKHGPRQFEPLDSYQNEINYERAGTGQVPTNPLSLVVVDAGVGDEAYGSFNGPSSGWAGWFVGPPPKNIVDIAIKAGKVATVVAALAFGRSGLRAVRGAPKTSNHTEFETASPASASPPAVVAPKLAKGTDVEMLGRAIRELLNMRGQQAAQTTAFEDMAGQITKATGGAWSASRWLATDGSDVFLGGKGDALIISAQGLFRGGWRTGGIARVGDRLLELDFSILRQLR